MEVCQGAVFDVVDAGAVVDQLTHVYMMDGVGPFRYLKFFRFLNPPVLRSWLWWM